VWQKKFNLQVQVNQNEGDNEYSLRWSLTEVNWIGGN
jgi:hypothetical protein